MKKHFWGFALFCLIVGTAAFIYAKFNVGSIVKVNAPMGYSTYSQTKSCWKMKRESSRTRVGSPMVRQAIFDLRSKQLRWELDTSEVDAPIALNFFIKDESGMRYVNSVLVPMAAYRHGSIIKATSSYEWLDKLDSYENLYVTAEPISQSAYQDKNFPVEINVGKLTNATAVLLY
jgi:hypothetical protein